MVMVEETTASLGLTTLYKDTKELKKEQNQSTVYVDSPFGSFLTGKSSRFCFAFAKSVLPR